MTTPTWNETANISEQPSGSREFGRSRWVHVTQLPTTRSPLETVQTSSDDFTTARARTEDEE